MRPARPANVLPFGERKATREARAPEDALLGPKEMLQSIVPALEMTEQAVRQLRQMLDRERVRLAKERGVAFIREETVRREFRKQG